MNDMRYFYAIILTSARFILHSHMTEADNGARAQVAHLIDAWTGAKSVYLYCETKTASLVDRCCLCKFDPNSNN